MELDGKIPGKFGSAGRQLKEFGSVHGIALPEPERSLRWRAYKLESTKTNVASLNEAMGKGAHSVVVQRASCLIAPAFVFSRGVFAAHFSRPLVLFLFLPFSIRETA